MRALVTGATGFLGAALTRRIFTDGHVAVSLVRDTADQELYETSVRSTVCMGDISSIKRIERILAEYRIDTVFHLAAQTEIRVAANDPIGTFESNVTGTWNVLEACRRQGVRRVVVASSDKVYGRAKPPYKEDMKLLPDRPYDSSKACADLLAQTYASTYKMSVAVTRCVNLYGPACKTLSTIVPNTIRRVLNGDRPIIRNGGSMKRDFLYIDDAVDAYMALAKTSWRGAMNFGSGRGYYVRDVTRKILRLMDSDLIPEDIRDEYGEITHQYSDCSLAKKVLGWKPKYTLDEGLKETVDWYVNRREE